MGGCFSSAIIPIRNNLDYNVFISTPDGPNIGGFRSLAEKHTSHMCFSEKITLVTLYSKNPFTEHIDGEDKCSHMLKQGKQYVINSSIHDVKEL